MGLLSRLRVKENLATLAAVSALRGVRDNLRGVVWQPFVLSLGVPMSSLGGLESVMDFSRTLVQPILGGASDAYGRKRFLLAREFLVLAAGVLLLLSQVLAPLPGSGPHRALVGPAARLELHGGGVL